MMSAEAWGYYQKHFPSDAFIRKILPLDYEERSVRALETLFNNGGIASYYETSAALGEAIGSGELTVHRSGGGNFYRINQKVFFARNNILPLVRRLFDSPIRVSAMQMMRRQMGQIRFKSVYLFKDGRYGNGVRHNDLPAGEEYEQMLAREFIEITRDRRLHEDSWWRYVYEGDSVYLKAVPKAHTILATAAAARGPETAERHV